MADINIVAKKGERKVTIMDEGYGLNLLLMTNGWQTTGTGVDKELLIMIKECIDKYFNEDESLKYAYCDIDQESGRYPDCVLDNGNLDNVSDCSYCYENNIKDKNKCPHWINP